MSHLQNMFPETDAVVVADVLRQCGGSTEEALEMLIEMNSGDGGVQPLSPAVSICDSDSEAEVCAAAKRCSTRR